MANTLKFSFVILGSLLIGLGIGLILPKSFQIDENYSWLAVIFALILGGFFLGFGIVSQAPKKEEIEEISGEKIEKTPEEEINQ